LCGVAFIKSGIVLNININGAGTYRILCCRVEYMKCGYSTVTWRCRKNAAGMGVTYKNITQKCCNMPNAYKILQLF
jgi:hypothetical protein